LGEKFRKAAYDTGLRRARAGRPLFRQGMTSEMSPKGGRAPIFPVRKSV